jgi:GDP-4-dehydro-6-deoxy-D-mannose reductase
MSNELPLVTGATGFAGGHLVNHLLESAPAVAAWGNPGGRKAPDNGSSGRVRWTAVDVTNIDQVARALGESRPTAVYHCAGIADVHSSWSDSAQALRVNVMGTHAVLEGLRRNGLEIPVVVTGSALVYRRSTEPMTEESPIGPSSPYGVSKLAQEMIASVASGRVIVTRPFNHAGPRQSDAYVTSSFARQIAEAEAGLREPVLRVGNLDSWRDITDVRDTVRAYRLLMERGTAHRPYNVCRGEAYRIGDLMEQLVGQAHVPIRVEVDPARLRPSDNPVVLGSPARIHHETGWSPEIAIDRTLGDLLDYWRGVVRTAGGAH